MTAEEPPFNIGKGELSELAGREEFVRVENRSRGKMEKLQPLERREHFEEIELGYTEEVARKEADQSSGNLTIFQTPVPSPAYRPDRILLEAHALFRTAIRPPGETG